MDVTLQQAASLLKTGHVVAVPTETVYGLAASINHPGAIEKIFDLKKRPRNNPLIVHLASGNALQEYARNLPASALKLALAFWPGPLTLLLPANLEKIDPTIRAHLPTAAFRVPNHPLAIALLELTGPLVMPSANPSGKPSATCAAHVTLDFGHDLPVLDGGACQQGVESTILHFTNDHWEIVRLGALPPEAFETVLGYVPGIHMPGQTEQPICPGQHYRHYAPQTELTLCNPIPKNTTDPIVGFSDRHYSTTSRIYALGHSDRPEEVAANLYGLLRTLDKENVPRALVDIDIPNEGLWLTIKERISKAASKDRNRM